MIIYLLYRIGHALAIALPLDVSYRAAIFLADAVYRLSARDRAAVIANLRVVEGPGCPDTELHRLAREVFRNFAKYLVDFFRFSRIDESFVRRYVTVRGLEHIREAAARGSGVVLLSAHIGNWELGALILSLLGFPLSAVALTHRNQKIDRFFNNQRRLGKVRPIPIGASLRTAYATLKGNGLLALMGDRDFTGHGVPTPFFGKTALIPKGPAAFAARVGSPIVPIFMVRNQDDSFSLLIEPPILPPQGEAEREAFRYLTRQCVSVMESYIRRYPAQWFAFRNIWEEHEQRNLRTHTII